MEKFEFVAVFLSIIFGLAMTNLLSGMLRAFFKKELTATRLAWSLAAGWVFVMYAVMVRAWKCVWTRVGKGYQAGFFIEGYVV
jgi:hypothetical protein